MPSDRSDDTSIARAHAKPWFYATRPTRTTVFLRTFLPYQLWRFVRINMKMIGIIRRGHGGHG